MWEALEVGLSSIVSLPKCLQQPVLMRQQLGAGISAQLSHMCGREAAMELSAAAS